MATCRPLATCRLRGLRSSTREHAPARYARPRACSRRVPTPRDDSYATPIAISYFETKKLQNVVVVSPDAGGVARAKMFREGLEASGMRASLAMIIPTTRTVDGAVRGIDGTR